MPRQRTSAPPTLLFPALILFVLVLAALVVREFRRAPVPPEAAVPSVPKRTVTLYFAGPAGDALVAETRELDDCPVDPPCFQALVEALIRGSAQGLVPVLPPQTTLRSVAAQGETLTVDFGRELVDHHPGGSLSELLTVAALANTIGKNVPTVRQVRILIDGQGVQTLKGHVSLREPFVADFSLVAAPPAAAPGPVQPSQGAR